MALREVQLLFTLNILKLKASYKANCVKTEFKKQGLLIKRYKYDYYIYNYLSFIVLNGIIWHTIKHLSKLHIAPQTYYFTFYTLVTPSAHLKLLQHTKTHTHRQIAERASYSGEKWK